MNPNNNVAKLTLNATKGSDIEPTPGAPIRIKRNNSYDHAMENPVDKRSINLAKQSPWSPGYEGNTQRRNALTSPADYLNTFYDGMPPKEIQNAMNLIHKDSREKALQENISKFIYSNDVNMGRGLNQQQVNLDITAKKLVQTINILKSYADEQKKSTSLSSIFKTDDRSILNKAIKILEKELKSLNDIR